MEEKILFTQKVKLLDILFPLIISIIINIVYTFMDSFNILLFSGLILLSIFFIFITKNNAVRIYAYENVLKVNFFLMNKKINVSYDEIKDIYFVSSGVYGGSFLKFIIKDNNDDIAFNLKLYNIEFIKFLEIKTNRKILF